MRTQTFIAVVVAIGVVIGGYIWYANQSDQPVIAGSETSLADTEVPDANLPTAEDAQASTGDIGEAPSAEGSGTESDAPIVVGDEITEDTIVVESATTEPVILDPESTASSVEVITGQERLVKPAETDDVAAIQPSETVEQTPPANPVAPAAPEDPLTPANFDRDEVMALIDASDQVSVAQRSALRALVEGAGANPEMMDGAINSIRTALNLPPLN